MFTKILVANRGEIAVRIIRDVANAAVLPVKKGMSEECRKELDKYFHRDKDKDKEKEKAE